MSYSKLLNTLIEKSGMTAKEIAEKCAEHGQKITASYISILRKEENKRVPSDDISRALAKVFGIDENILLLEAFLDNAPPLLKKALRNFYYATAEIAVNMFGGEIPQNLREDFKKLIDEAPLSEIVIELAENTNLSFNNNVLIENEVIDGTTLNMQFHANPEFDVLDNSMEQKLPKGSRVKIKMQNEYKSGDIVAFKEKGSEKLQYRKLCITKKGEQLLVAFHPDYEILEFDSEKMVILGRVVEVITQIWL
jgi:transcriptional regulator with XRE-family HTH domain